MDSVRLARSFGVGLNALRMRAYRLGIVKTDDVRNELCQRSLGREIDECEAAPRIEVLPGDAPGIVRIVRHRLMR
jgi:Zn-dependent peptidase ImmA (M78 family)